MNKQNSDFINQIKIDDIPWHRLTTPFGRAGEFPELLRKMQAGDSKAFEDLAQLIEHQSTLYHSTPFAFVFICRILKEGVDDCEFKRDILGFLSSVAEETKYILENIIEEEGIKAAELLLADMLAEKYLGCEVYDEEDGWEFYDGEGGEEFQAGFYHYTIEVLKHFADVFAALESDPDSEVRESAAELGEIFKHD
jgi:hypothetical protein